MYTCVFHLTSSKSATLQVGGALIWYLDIAPVILHEVQPEHPHFPKSALIMTFIPFPRGDFLLKDSLFYLVGKKFCSDLLDSSGFTHPDSAWSHVLHCKDRASNNCLK